jgi:hypothetical protein
MKSASAWLDSESKIMGRNKSEVNRQLRAHVMRLGKKSVEQ